MRILALDIGTKRIGVAFADTTVRIAVPRDAILVDGGELDRIIKQYQLEKAELIVVGLPRNNQGAETAQTSIVREFVSRLEESFDQHIHAVPPIKMQDESLTSVAAEGRLGGNISRAERMTGKVDSEAAAIILQDFIETANYNQQEKEANGLR